MCFKDRNTPCGAGVFRVAKWYRKTFGRTYHLRLQCVDSGDDLIMVVREDEVRVVGRERPPESDAETLRGADVEWGDDETLRGD